MKYEYKVLFRCDDDSVDTLEAKLNELGRVGFKLVAVTETFNNYGHSTGDTLYLARQISEE